MGVALFACVLGARAGGAQELEPRAYAANPTGVLFGVVSLGYSTGDVVLEPSSPITDVSAKVYPVAVGIGTTYALFGRTASASLGVPYAWAKVSGNIGEQAASVERSGLADARARLGISLLGGRAMTLPEFVRRKPTTNLGASLTIAVPTGQYFDDKLVNIGTNRWAFKPELGISHPAGPWTLEVHGGAWFFTRNTSYFGGKTKEQHPLTSLQAHVGYTIRPRLWVAADATFYSGGRVVTDGVPATVREENTRIGLTASIPMRRSNSLKLAWSTGAVTRLGGNFVTWSLVWQTTHIRIPARPVAGRVDR